MDQPEATAMKIVPIMPEGLPVVYSNLVAVNRSQNEYFLTFCLMQPGTSQKADEAPSIQAIAQIQIVLPPAVADGLIQAMQAQAKVQLPSRSATEAGEDT